MASRPIPFVNDSIYHLVNRGVEKRDIFLNRGDYQRFIDSMFHYQTKNPIKFSLSRNKNTPQGWKNEGSDIIKLLSYCLMPNHFHMLVKQTIDGGITRFMSQVQNSYTRSFNTKYKRIGPLFQGPFKAVLIETDEQLVHVSRYIHLNPVVSNLTKTPEQYEWSSYKIYLGLEGNQQKIETNDISLFFKTPESYKDFVTDHIDYARTLESLKHKSIDL